MKDFSHPGQSLEETDLNTAIETTVQICRNEWKHVATVHLDLDPQLPVVSCYQGELKQALLNMVVNAAQAIAEQRAINPNPSLGTITVRTTRRGDFVTITVADDGPGMEEAVRTRIFDQFFTTKGVGKGTGQGLALVHSTIVTKHSGSISVESAPGRGTVFTITLPTRGPSTTKA